MTPPTTTPRRTIFTASRVLPIAAGVAALLILLPVVALALRAPWRDAAGLLTSPGVLDAARLSLIVSVGAVVLSLLIGFPVAWTLARVEFPGRSVLRTVVLMPMVLPPIVGGVALLAAFGRNGLLGGVLASVGVSLPFTTAGAVVAVTFVSCPFMILSLESGLNGLDRRFERAAETLGAGGWTVIRRVVLPALAPALRAGIALTWARALGEFGATVAFAGSHPHQTRTLPLAIYDALSTDLDAAVMLGLLLVAISLAVLLVLGGRMFTR
ncbi:MAG TPA: molybdate ABC transporter permease subunit [Phycisphaerales bacterium]|nr:molybdate ABC transporter permease subunit [Phycisphaerales bacterium]